MKKIIYFIIGIITIILSLIPIIWFFILEFFIKEANFEHIIFNSGIWVLIPFVISLIMGIIYLRFGRGKLETSKISDWSLKLFILAAVILLIFMISGFFISLPEKWMQTLAVIYLIFGFLIFLISIILLIIDVFVLRKNKK